MGNSDSKKRKAAKNRKAGENKISIHYGRSPEHQSLNSLKSLKNQGLDESVSFEFAFSECRTEVEIVPKEKSNNLDTALPPSPDHMRIHSQSKRSTAASVRSRDSKWQAVPNGAFNEGLDLEEEEEEEQEPVEYLNACNEKGRRISVYGEGLNQGEIANHLELKKGIINEPLENLRASKLGTPQNVQAQVSASSEMMIVTVEPEESTTLARKNHLRFDEEHIPVKVNFGFEIRLKKKQIRNLGDVGSRSMSDNKYHVQAVNKESNLSKGRSTAPPSLQGHDPFVQAQVEVEETAELRDI